MATVIRMPEVLANTAEAAIQTWLVKLGDAISIGSPLAEVETEKAVVEYAAETGGTVLQLLVEEGQTVQVGEPIAVVGAVGESIPDAAPTETAAAVPAPAAAPVTSPAPEPESAPEVVPDPLDSAPTELRGSAASVNPDRRFISPLVRRLAKERGLDLAGLTGSGPNGRIVRLDIEGLEAPVVAAPVAAPAEPEGGFIDVPHTGMRRAIARRLTESKSTVPHFYVVADCRVDELLDLRARVNETASVKVSVNDFVLKAAAAAFIDVPDANATWGETAIRRYETVDMSVAVSIDGGLVTPVLRSVERMSLTEVTRAVADLAERARAGRLKQHELEGGSFAVSNLGMYGVTEFSAIINPPQSAILAVGRATQRPVVVDGELAVATVMTVTLSADHRVLDGALAAQWVAAFVSRIEHPLGMLV